MNNLIVSQNQALTMSTIEISNLTYKNNLEVKLPEELTYQMD